MNKRIKKKRERNSMIEVMTYMEFPGNTKTPHWKRVKASGRKYMMCLCTNRVMKSNRNNRVCEYSLVQKALKKGISHE